MSSLLRAFALFFLSIALPVAAASASAQDQRPADGTRVSSAEVSGLDLSRLSPGLRQDIENLVGTSLDAQRLADLAARLEAEQPRYVAAVRTTAAPDGTARVVFVVARIRDADAQVNINARYVVEDVDIRGVPDEDITAEIRADLNALLGRTLDAELAERIETRLASVFIDYRVIRRTGRGTRPGRIRVTFQLTRTEASQWLRFDRLDSNLVFHSDQGWGGRLPLSVSSGGFRFAPYFAFDVGDDLVEEYSGFGLRVESRRLGTERLGLSFDWSTLDSSWRDETIAAIDAGAAVPALYRNRMTVTPVLKFAITPQVSVGGGVSITELDALDESSDEARMANAAVGLVNFSQRWRETSASYHGLDATFSVRAGTESLESDLVYERYLVESFYGFRRDHHRVLASAMFGGISGEAPLFERFSLGDSRTLRGWDKRDIAPTGGDRMFHASVEYRYRVLALFLDSGSVWDSGHERRVRFSSGVGLSAGPWFATVGFPINTDEFRAVFTTGVRFGWWWNLPRLNRDSGRWTR